jgi:hypothetical protein
MSVYVESARNSLSPAFPIPPQRQPTPPSSDGESPSNHSCKFVFQLGGALTANNPSGHPPALLTLPTPPISTNNSILIPTQSPGGDIRTQIKDFIVHRPKDHLVDLLVELPRSLELNHHI